MTLSKVKPCPFCGGEDIGNDCHATGPDEPLPDRDWSAARWNRRPLEERLEAEIERLEKRIAELETPERRRG